MVFNSKVKLAGNTRCLPTNCTNGVQYFNLSTRNNCPVLKTININRDLKDKSKMAYKDLERSIQSFGFAFQPILVTSDYFILDGQHRWKIVNNLWDQGIDVGISMVVCPNITSTDDDIRQVIIDLQKGHAWTPEDKIKSLSLSNNETAQFIQKMANEPVSFFKANKFGMRNAFVVLGLNPNNFDDIPEFLSMEVEEEGKKLFKEIKTLLTIGKRENDKANNWTEPFIKAWRRIRLNYKDLEKVDENGEKLVIDSEALNNMIEYVGIPEIGTKWRAYADSAFSSGKVGRWVEIFEKTIVQTYEWKSRISACEETF